MNGFKIIRVGTTTTSQIVCEHGMISYKPNLRYQVEKRNAFDPTYIHRRGAYHEDTIKLTAMLTPAEYYSLLAVLNKDGAFYLRWTSAGSDIILPVTPDDLPELSDDLNEYPDKVNITMISRYTGFTPTIEEGIESLTEFTETLTIGD